MPNSSVPPPPRVILIDSVCPEHCAASLRRAGFCVEVYVSLKVFFYAPPISDPAVLVAVGDSIEDAVPEAAVAAIRACRPVLAVVFVSQLRDLHLAISQPSRAIPDFPSLTPSEWEVLTELYDGLSNLEIAMKVGRSELTVKSIVSVLLSKFDVPRREVLVAKLHRMGLFHDRGLAGLPSRSGR